MDCLELPRKVKIEEGKEPLGVDSGSVAIGDAAAVAAGIPGLEPYTDPDQADRAKGLALLATAVVCEAGWGDGTYDFAAHAWHGEATAFEIAFDHEWDGKRDRWLPVARSRCHRALQ